MDEDELNQLLEKWVKQMEEETILLDRLLGMLFPTVDQVNDALKESHMFADETGKPFNHEERNLMAQQKVEEGDEPRETESERVSRWRFESLLRAGYDRDAAERLSESSADLELARRLIHGGCKPTLALDILM